MEPSEFGFLTGAQVLCKDSSKWLLDTCKNQVRKHWFSDYKAAAAILARQVYAECRTISDSDWEQTADKWHCVFRIVEKRAAMLAATEAALTNSAQRFVLSHKDWVRETCHQAIRKTNSSNFIEDVNELQNETYVRCGQVPDSKWAEKKDKHKYVGKIIHNAARSRRKKTKEDATDDASLMSLVDATVSRDPVEQMLAGILVKEILDRASPKERQLFNDRNHGYEWPEIAKNRRMSEEAARQAFSRLKRKAATASKGKTATEISGERQVREDERRDTG